MTHTEEMLQTHPNALQLDPATLGRAIDALNSCAQSCTACADACLGEPEVSHLTRCIRLDLDCADICYTTSRVLTRQTEPDWTIIRSQLQACITSCGINAAECEQHASHHEHCRVCAEACRTCEEACKQLLLQLPA